MSDTRVRRAAMAVVALLVVGVALVVDRPTWLGVDWLPDDSARPSFPSDAVVDVVPPPGYDVESSLWGPLICPSGSSVDRQPIGSVGANGRLDGRHRHAALVAAQEYVADTFAASAPIREARLHVVNRPHGDAVLADWRMDGVRLLSIGAVFTVVQTSDGVALTGALYCSDFVEGAEAG